MWNFRYLTRIDFRVIPLIFCLMMISLLVISSYSMDITNEGEEVFLTPDVKRQMKSFFIGICVFIFFAGFDYNKLREWTWIVYILTLISLIGLFFTESIQNVHRWYRLPFINASFQPSEYAKLVVVVTLSWFLERTKARSHTMRTALGAILIVGIPFILILKQPDLGTALILFPIALVMFYFGDINPAITRCMAMLSLAVLLFVAVIFLNIVSYEEMKPFVTKFLKEYQYERLNPNTHHQKTAAIAIAVGGLTGTGWRKSEYTSGGWLPTPTTDSVFPSFGEEFGFIGLLILLSLFYALIYFSFQVTVVAKDQFGRLLSAGVAVYLAVHILMNIGMMSGFLPITGVPLIFITYGGSSILLTMTALGILQSIYSRRFMF